MMNYRKIIYVAHPFNNLKSNINKVEKILNDIQEKYPDYLFLSPIHTFGWLYESIDYQKGLGRCFWLIDKADEVWMFGDWEKSRGCLAEIEYCKQKDKLCVLHVAGDSEFYDE